MADKYDTELIKRENPLSDYLPRRGISLKRNGREWLGCCPFHADGDPSLTVFMSREGHEKYQCFPCGEFGNVIDFVQRFDGVEFIEACEILAGTREERHKNWTPILRTVDYFDPYKGFEILPPPADAPLIEKGKRTPQLRNPKREGENDGPKFVTYTPSLVHPYRQADGALIGYVLRVDIEEGRKITPLILWAKKGDWQGWTHHPMPEPRPLYGLDRAAAKPKAQWNVGEGEKVADVLADLFPQMAALSWQGGGKAYARSDWSPVKGKSVLNWMDNDDEGERTMLGSWKGDEWKPGVIELQLRAGAKTVKLIGRDEDKPKGWDIADAYLQDGWTADEILFYAKERAQVWTLDDIAARKTRLKNPASSGPTRADNSGEVAPSPSPALSTPRAQMRVVPGGQAQAVPLQARAPQPERIVEPGEVPAIKRYSTALAIDDTVDIPLLGRMEMDDKGNPRKRSVHNYIVTSRYHPQMEGVLAWDEFSSRVMMMKRPPWIAGTGPWTPRKIENDDALLASAWFSRQAGLRPNENECGAAMSATAKYNPTHPVRDYLDTLKWDGMPRIRGEANVCAPWLTEYLGARDSKINRAFGMRWLISAVARVYNPGEKVDSMLILEGPQGAGKSTALRILGTLEGQSYFTDSVHDLVGKEAVQQFRGKWIIEISELDAMRKHDFNAVKAVVSRQVDNIRLPYAKHAEDIPRQCVFAGTVNPSGTGYLKDPTGARRFWPVRVGAVDIERLTEDAEQIWAEAVHLYREGEQWHLTEEEALLAMKVQKARQEEEPWANPIETYASDKSIVLIDGIMDALGLPRSQWTTAAQNRIADYLRSNGWEKSRRRIAGDLKYCYVRSDNQADD